MYATLPPPPPKQQRGSIQAIHKKTSTIGLRIQSFGKHIAKKLSKNTAAGICKIYKMKLNKKQELPRLNTKRNRDPQTVF